MPRERFPIRDIQSFMPSVDVRNTEEPYVLSGRNYVFDTKGPKSGFGSRLVCGLNSIEVANGSVQDVAIAERTFVCSTQGIYELAENEQSWIQHVDFNILFEPEYIPFLDQQQWTGAYLSDGVYLCHKTYGFYKLTRDGFDKITVEDLAGFPERPIAIAETNGRLIVLNQDFVAWSAPSQAERFVPELGGAGQQRLSDRVTGTPIAVVGFQRGFLVWTTEDCLLAEFIGGDTVFRFDRMTTDQIPVGPMAIEELPDGSQIICTKQGLFVTANGGEPKDVTPLFNQFIRNFLKKEPGIIVRLDYNMEYDHLYVQLRDWTNHNVRTYVVTVALDRWGEFNERHLGIVRYSAKRGSLGYVDQAGVVHKFVETFNKEVTPHTFEGLDSQIDVGYLKPPRLVEEGKIDTLLEMQELFIGGVARPSWSQPTVIDCGELPLFNLLPDYAFYLQFHGSPVYWVKHAAAPDGEYFDTKEELLTGDAALPENDVNLGLPLQIANISVPDSGAIPGVANQTLLGQNELLEAMQGLLASEEGFTIAFEYDSADQHAADVFMLTDAEENHAIIFGTYSEDASPAPNVYPGYAPNYARNRAWWYMSTYDEMYEEKLVTDTLTYGLNRVALSMKRIPGGYRFALALNGVVHLSYDETGTYYDGWVPTVMHIGKTPNALVYNEGAANFIRNDSNIKKFIGYSDGDETKVAERSTIAQEKTHQCFYGNPVNANAGILELTSGSLSLFTPAETQENDLLIATLYARSPITPPAGWTLLASQARSADYFWNQNHTGDYTEVQNPFNYVRVDKSITQTTYIYTRVAEAGDDALQTLWGIQTPDICGGQIVAFRRSDGVTPEIIEANLVNDIHGEVSTGFDWVRQPDGTHPGGYKYIRMDGIKGVEYRSTRHDSAVFMVATAGMVSVCMADSHLVVPPYPVSTDDLYRREYEETYQQDAQYTDDGLPIRPYFGTSSSFPSDPGTTSMHSAWHAWEIMTPLVGEERNRFVTAWRQLPREQSTFINRGSDDGVSHDTYNNYRLNLGFTKLIDFLNTPNTLGPTAADHCVVVGTLLIA